MTLTAPWDGRGMTATQSHGMRFDGFPAVSVEISGTPEELASVQTGLVGAAFSAVIVGVVDSAMDEVRARLEPRRGELRPFERVEWARATTEAWLIEQALERLLRSAEAGGGPAELVGKTAIAEYAESVLTRLCRVVGGGAYSRRSPLGFWLEDVRALGYLRPPWGLAYDQLYEGAWPQG